MTISLEQLRDGSVSDRNFQTLMRLVLDTGGLTIGMRFGTTTLTFTASTVSATATINHGLGSAPIAVLLGSRDALMQPGCFARSGTQLSINGLYNSSVSTTAAVDWVAIG